MANKKEFIELANEIQAGNSKEVNDIVERAKEGNRKSNIVTLIICLIIDFIIICGFNFNLMVLVPIIMTDLFVYAMVSLVLNGKNHQEYNKKFKEIIVEKLLGNFYDRLEYFPYKQMPERIYREGRYEYYDRYYSDDYLEAKIDNKYDIEMAEIRTEEIERYKDSEGRSREETHTLFSGLFAKIVMDKSINSELVINPNSLIRANKNRLEMDSRRI